MFTAINLVIAIAIPATLIILVIWGCRSYLDLKNRVVTLESRLSGLERKESE